MLTSNAEEFQSDELKYGTAKRRGYLRSPHSAAPAPKPNLSFADQEAGGQSGGTNLSLWTDDPRQRASPYEPWDDEDVRFAISRLWVHKNPDVFLAHIWMEADPPLPDSTTGLSFDQLFLLSRQLGLVDRGPVRRRVNQVLAAARDTGVRLPDYNPIGTFDSGLVDSITAVIDQGGQPDGSADAAALIELFSGLTVEGAAQPMTEIEPRRVRHSAA